MKFITEEILRQFYDENPAFEYALESTERLTPGARQFLLDRGVNLYDKIQSPIIRTLQNDNSEQKKFLLKLNVLQVEYLMSVRELKRLCSCEFNALLDIHELLCIAAQEQKVQNSDEASEAQKEQTCNCETNCIEQSVYADYLLHIAKLRAKTALLAMEVPMGTDANFNPKSIINTLNRCEQLLILELKKVAKGELCP